MRKITYSQHELENHEDDQLSAKAYEGLSENKEEKDAYDALHKSLCLMESSMHTNNTNIQRKHVRDNLRTVLKKLNIDNEYLLEDLVDGFFEGGYLLEDLIQ